MAIELTTDEQAQLAIQATAHANMIELEQVRVSGQATSIRMQHKLELLRHAKEVLLANRSNAPIGEREVTDEEIVKYATTLQTFLDN